MYKLHQNDDGHVWIYPPNSSGTQYREIKFSVNHVDGSQLVPYKNNKNLNITVAIDTAESTGTDEGITLKWRSTGKRHKASITLSSLLLKQSITNQFGAFKKFLIALDEQEEKKLIKSGGARVIAALTAESLPMPLNYVQHFHLGLSEQDDEKYIDLSVGMNLSLVYSNYYNQEHDKTGDQQPLFCGTGTDQVTLNSEFDPINKFSNTVFNVFLEMQEVKVNEPESESIQNARLGSSVLDLAAGPRGRYHRIYYGDDSENPTNLIPLLAGQPHNTALVSAHKYSDLTPSAGEVEHQSPLVFFGRTTVIPEITVIVNGERRQFPVGTKVRNLVEMDEALEGPPEKLRVQRYFHGKDYEVTNSSSASPATLLDLPLIKGDKVRWYPRDDLALIERAQAIFRVTFPENATVLTGAIVTSFGDIKRPFLPEADDMAVALRASNSAKPYSARDIAVALYENYNERPLNSSSLNFSQTAHALYFAGFKVPAVAQGLLAIVKPRIQVDTSDLLVEYLISAEAGYSARQIAKAVYIAVDGYTANRRSTANLVSALIEGSKHANQPYTPIQVTSAVFEAINQPLPASPNNNPQWFFTNDTANNLAYGLKRGSFDTDSPYSANQVGEGLYQAFVDHDTPLTIGQLATALALAQKFSGYDVVEVSQAVFAVFSEYQQTQTPFQIATALHVVTRPPQDSWYSMAKAARGVYSVSGYLDTADKPMPHLLTEGELAQAIQRAYSGTPDLLAKALVAGMDLNVTKSISANNTASALAEVFEYDIEHPQTDQLTVLASALAGAGFDYPLTAKALVATVPSLSAKALAVSLKAAYTIPPITVPQVAQAITNNIPFTVLEDELDVLARVLYFTFNDPITKATTNARAIYTALHKSFADKPESIIPLAAALARVTSPDKQPVYTPLETASALYTVFSKDLAATDFMHLVLQAMEEAYPKLGDTERTEMEDLAGILANVFLIKDVPTQEHLTVVAEELARLFNIDLDAKQASLDEEVLSLALSTAHSFTNFATTPPSSSVLLAKAIAPLIPAEHEHSLAYALYHTFHDPQIKVAELISALHVAYDDVKSLTDIAVDVVALYEYPTGDKATQNRIDEIATDIVTSYGLRHGAADEAMLLAKAIHAAFKLDTGDIGVAQLAKTLANTGFSVDNTCAALKDIYGGLLTIHTLLLALVAAYPYIFSDPEDVTPTVTSSLPPIELSAANVAEIANASVEAFKYQHNEAEEAKTAILVGKGIAAAFPHFVTPTSSNAPTLAAGLQSAGFSSEATAIALDVIFAHHLTLQGLVEALFATFGDNIVKAPPSATLPAWVKLFPSMANPSTANIVAITTILSDPKCFNLVPDSTAHGAQIADTLQAIYPQFSSNPETNGLSFATALQSVGYTYQVTASTLFTFFSGQNGSTRITLADLTTATIKAYATLDIGLTEMAAKLMLLKPDLKKFTKSSAESLCKALFLGFSHASAPSAKPLIAALVHAYGLKPNSAAMLDYQTLASALEEFNFKFNGDEGVTRALYAALISPSISPSTLTQQTSFLAQGIYNAYPAQSITADALSLELIATFGYTMNAQDPVGVQSALNDLIHALNDALPQRNSAASITRVTAAVSSSFPDFYTHWRDTQTDVYLVNALAATYPSGIETVAGAIHSNFSGPGVAPAIDDERLKTDLLAAYSIESTLEKTNLVKLVANVFDELALNLNDVLRVVKMLQGITTAPTKRAQATAIAHCASTIFPDLSSLSNANLLPAAFKDVEFTPEDSAYAVMQLYSEQLNRADITNIYWPLYGKHINPVVAALSGAFGIVYPSAYKAITAIEGETSFTIKDNLNEFITALASAGFAIEDVVEAIMRTVTTAPKVPIDDLISALQAATGFQIEDPDQGYQIITSIVQAQDIIDPERPYYYLSPIVAAINSHYPMSSFSKDSCRKIVALFSRVDIA